MPLCLTLRICIVKQRRINRTEPNTENGVSDTYIFDPSQKIEEIHGFLKFRTFEMRQFL